MKLVRVLNPSGLRANSSKRKGKTMAKRRKRRRNASVGRPRSVARKAVTNPRRRRRSRRNPTTIVTRSARRTINPKRRRNPSVSRVTSLVKDAIYGGGGAILTRAASSLVGGFVPSQFATSPLARPVTEVAIAVIPVRWLGKKFLGQRQGDLMMAGGLISAVLAAADYYLPNVQSQIQNVFRPIFAAPQAALLPAAVPLAGMGDVYDVQTLPGSFAGFGDVEDVPLGIW